MQIDQTTLLALIALVVSVCGFLVSIWSAVISHKALNHNRNSYEEQQRIAFERERSQLLELFNDSRKLHDQTLIEIESFKTQFNGESELVKTLFEKHTDIFNEYLQMINGGLRQANSLWNEVAEWDERNGLHALAHHQARYRTLITDDLKALDQVLIDMSAFKEKIKLAIKNIAFEAALENPIATSLR